MMVETTHAFVKLKQIKAAVSAGGIKFKTRGSPRLELCDIYYTKSAYSEKMLQPVGHGVLTWQSGVGEYCQCRVHDNATNDWEQRDGCQPVIRNSDQ